MPPTAAVMHLFAAHHAPRIPSPSFPLRAVDARQAQDLHKHCRRFGPMGFPTINDKEIVMNWDTVTQSTYRHAGNGCRKWNNLPFGFGYTGSRHSGQPRAIFIKSH